MKMKIATVKTLKLKNAHNRHVGPPKPRGKYVVKNRLVQLRVEARAQVVDDEDYLRLFDSGALFAQDSTFPCQFFADPAWSGQRLLMAAVLKDAVAMFLQKLPFSSECSAWQRRQRPLVQEAEEWLWNDDTSWPFSFLNICNELGLDAGQVRSWTEEKLMNSHAALLDPKQFTVELSVRE